MRKLRILIAEDEFISRSLLVKFLEGLGPCDTASNGEEAVERFVAASEAREPYDLVILDIMMPVLDGQEALSRIRAYESGHGVLAPDGCKIIMATALSDAANVMSAFRNQAEGYVTKPYVGAKIQEEVRKLGFVF